MYRYFQLSEFDHWRVRQDDYPNEPWRFAAEQQAVRVTILTPSIDIDLKRSDEIISYAGPLLFDIDDPNLEQALRSANYLCKKLQTLDVEEKDIEVHLSGKKGVHIYIDSRVFAKEDTYPDLAAIHARLALQLWVEGMDFQVYSDLKGRMVRPPNARRPDGAYKVQVSVSELAALTTEQYKALVKERRPLLDAGPRKYAAKLGKLFEACRVYVSKKEKKERPLPDNAINTLVGQIPHCIELLATRARKRETKGDATTSFNNLAIQVGCWSKVAGLEPVQLRSYHERIAQVNPSSTGEPEDVRVRKLHAMHLYLLENDRYKFSCGGIKKLVDGTPNCQGCVVYAQGGPVSNTLLASTFVHERNGCYFSDAETTNMIAPFTLRREYMVLDEDTNQTLHSVMLVTVPIVGMTYRIEYFMESAWNSKAQFKSQLEGLDGVTFFGSDNDVGRIKMNVTRQDLADGGEVKQVFHTSKMGIIYKKRAGSPDNPRDPRHKGRLTYVEPGWSFNNAGVSGTHKLSAYVSGAPHMEPFDLNSKLSTEANHSFWLMSQINEKRVLSGLVGWFIACHLKTHIFQLEHKFPVCCVSGVAGTGKNSTVAVLMRLAGVQGEGAHITWEAPNATKLPFQLGMTNSSTIPRVINEMNPKSMHKNHYNMVIEMIKAAFDGQRIQKGRLGGGPKGGSNVSVDTWLVSAPIIVLSEEPIETPAVMQRSLMLTLVPSGLRQGTTAFRQLEPYADALAEIGMTLIRSAVETPIGEVASRFDSTTLPPEISTSAIPERILFGYRVILLAYDWAYDNLERSGLAPGNLEILKSMRLDFLDYIMMNTESILQESAVTEVDRVLHDMAAMALAAANYHQTYNWVLQTGTHYAVHDGLLYLDTMQVYPLYLIYKRSHGEGAISITTETAFLKVVRSMDYFDSGHATTTRLPLNGRRVLSLNMEKMQRRGIRTQAFIPTS